MNLHLDNISPVQITYVERQCLIPPYTNFQKVEFKVFYTVDDSPQVLTVFLKEDIDKILFDVYGNVKGYLKDV